MLCTVFLVPQAQAAQLRIAVVLSESAGAYQEFASHLQSANSQQHVLSVVGVGDPVRDADLVIAVGMKAAMAFSSSSVPVLNVLVPRAGIEGLQRAPSSSFSAIFMDQPMDRQLALLELALPEAKKIGILYATPPAALATLRKLLGSKQLSLHEKAVNRERSLASALTALLEQSEVLLVLPDAAIYNSDTIRNILLETYHKQVPVIGISQNYVRAGALCAVYSTPQQFARQASLAIDHFAATGKLPGSQYANEFDVSVNMQVARSLGLHIKDAEQLRLEIRRTP